MNNEYITIDDIMKLEFFRSFDNFKFENSCW